MGDAWRLSPAAVVGAIVALVALGAAVIAIAGGGDDGTPRSGSATAGERAGTLVLGWFLPPTGRIANPYVQAGSNLASDGLWQLVFEPLFYFNYQTGKSEPWLAESYAYSDGHKTITLKLRDDVRWSDGTPFTADDIVFTVEQILRAKAPYQAANIKSSIAGVRAAGRDEVRIELKASNPRFVDTELSSYTYTANFIPLPRHIFRGRSLDTFSFYDLAKDWPVGTGPYRLTAVTASGATFGRDDRWWAAKAAVEELPAPKRVVFTKPGPEDSTISGLVSNRLDYAGLSVPSVAGFLAARKRNPKLINWDADTGWLDPCPFALTINATRKPWDDPRMRRALSAALDKQQFSRLFNTPGKPTPARTSYPEYPKLTALLDANRDLLERYPTLDHDVASAERTFQSKGYAKRDGVWVRDGKPLSLTLSIFTASALGPVWRDAAQLLDQQLATAGIEAKLAPADGNAIYDARASASFDAQTWFECGSVTDPWATLNRYTNAPGNDNAGKWSNPEYDRLVARMGKLPPGDPGIQPLFRRALEILLRELPVIPLAQRPTPIVMNQTYWTNWPTAKHAYTQPPPWWMNFHQVITQLRPAR
jgi:peptide/nickel transport system substrate-binding protein